MQSKLTHCGIDETANISDHPLYNDKGHFPYSAERYLLMHEYGVCLISAYLVQSIALNRIITSLPLFVLVMLHDRAFIAELFCMSLQHDIFGDDKCLKGLAVSVCGFKFSI